MAEWQPIETAPKDDATRILLVAGGNIFIGWWAEEAEFGGEEGTKPGWQLWLCDNDPWYSDAAEKATHWMPLPEPPK